MTNVYEGTPDARQSPSTSEPLSLFRPRYRALSDDEKALHDAIKAKADELAALFVQVDTTTRQPLASAGIDPLQHLTYNRGANITLGLRHLEDAVYRVVKALTG